MQSLSWIRLNFKTSNEIQSKSVQVNPYYPFHKLSSPRFLCTTPYCKMRILHNIAGRAQNLQIRKLQRAQAQELELVFRTFFEGMPLEESILPSKVINFAIGASRAQTIRCAPHCT